MAALWLVFGLQAAEVSDSSLSRPEAAALFAAILAPAAFGAFLLRRHRERIASTASKAWPSLGAIVWIFVLAACILQASYFWDDAEYGEAFYRGHVVGRVSLLPLSGACYAGILVSTWALARRPSPVIGGAFLLALIAAMYASEIATIWLGL